MTDAQLASFTKQLANDMLITDVPTESEKGVYAFSFSPEIVVNIGSLQPGFYFIGKLGLSPTQKCEEFYTTLMLANLFGQGTGGAVIGLDDEGKTLVLSRSLPYAATYSQFKEYLEEFVNYLDLWQKKTMDASSTAQPPIQQG